MISDGLDNDCDEKTDEEICDLLGLLCVVFLTADVVFTYDCRP